MKISRKFGAAVITWGMATASGFANGSSEPVAPAPHPSLGPHRGSLIELGDEEFHAELVHDDSTDTITIYVLDHEARRAVPVRARSVTLDIRAAGRSHRYTLVAKVRDAEVVGEASVFAASDNMLCQLLDVDGTSVRLTIEIDGKSFVGQMGKHAHHEKMN